MLDFDLARVRQLLSRVDMHGLFPPAMLNRAETGLLSNRLRNVEVVPDGTGHQLRAEAMGTGRKGQVFEPWVALPAAPGATEVRSGCDCHQSQPCEHVAMLLMNVQVFPPEMWPKRVDADAQDDEDDTCDEPTPPRRRAAPPTYTPPSRAAPAPVPMPEWLQRIVDNTTGQAQAGGSAWDRWFAQLARAQGGQTKTDVEDDDDSRSFGILLRGDDNGRLLANPAFFRQGRGRQGGLVDPKPVLLTTKGADAAPTQGWSNEDLIALAGLLGAPGDRLKNGAFKDCVVVESAHAELALTSLLERWPAYFERGSVPLEAGPAREVGFVWADHPDGSQELQARVEAPEQARLLRGHGLWYVLPDARIYGRVKADLGLMEAIESAPRLQPEDVTSVQPRLKRIAGVELPAPKIRRVRSISPTPVPVLSMSVVETSALNTNRRLPQRLGVAALFFDYEGHRLSPTEGLEAKPRLLHQGEVVEIERDRRKEQRTEARLEQAELLDARLWAYDAGITRSPFAHNQHLLQQGGRRVPLAPEAWTAVLGELAGSGFRIEYTPEFPRDDVVDITGWNATIEERGNAWFDVTLGIDVGGTRVDLLPILRRILADPEFPLRPHSDEKPDATWKVRLDDSRSIKLPLARLRAMIEPLLEWLLADDRGLRVHRTQADALLRVAEGAKLSWRGGEKLRNRIEQLKQKPATIGPPPSFRAELRPYQRDGLNWLNFLADAGLGGILADDMGLGKTVQVLAHLCCEKARGKLKQPALVVAPTSLVGNWRDETARFAPDLKVLVLHGAGRAARYEEIRRHDMVITTYPLLPRDRDDLRAQQFSLLIMDEAQAIKNARSQAAQVVREIPAKRRLAMTGTPLENHLGELWAQFDAVEPGLLGSEKAFGRAYRTPIEKHGDAERQQRLNKRVGPLLLRRRKEDVLTELPPKTEIVHPLELSGSQRQLYESLRLSQHERVRESIAARGLAQSGIVVLDALLKLRQACCDPRLVKLDSARKVEESAKLDALLELLDGLMDEGRKVLVFSQFTTMLELIAQALNERKHSFLQLTGDTPAGQRTELVREFQTGSVPVFLISLKAGGVGLNLTAADAVIHYDPWWNPAVESQATDRAHRMGQDKPVFVYKLICAGTVEEKIQAMQGRKAELARAVLEGGGSTTSLRFDESDLSELFAPLD